MSIDWTGLAGVVGPDEVQHGFVRHVLSSGCGSPGHVCGTFRVCTLSNAYVVVPLTAYCPCCATCTTLTLAQTNRNETNRNGTNRNGTKRNGTEADSQPDRCSCTRGEAVEDKTVAVYDTYSTLSTQQYSRAGGRIPLPLAPLDLPMPVVGTNLASYHIMISHTRIPLKGFLQMFPWKGFRGARSRDVDMSPLSLCVRTYWGRGRGWGWGLGRPAYVHRGRAGWVMGKGKGKGVDWMDGWVV
ncbi:hypothetical protein P171DRAFT_266829 [Karstenula rhodostoma CBS 690.94]|uniref:Uncharacterized protein n=1 Tax=Karstenula rhodostoma CBS 690.94 TaxID=1392251 RepID=A0A9P4UDU4_9PLEO|nr:hypothetical protein P171DRAFT_266829 [Karstenula rhodostoma CBS 690.94]